MQKKDQLRTCTVAHPNHRRSDLRIATALLMQNSFIHKTNKSTAIQRIVLMLHAQFFVKTLKTQFIRIKMEVYHHATTLTITVNQSRVLRCR